MKKLLSRVSDALINAASRRLLLLALASGPVVGSTLALSTMSAHGVTAEGKDGITIDNFTFATKDLNIAVGTTVTWVNHDDIPHTVVEKDKSFRSKALDTDDSYSFTFTTPGVFEYFCGLHPQMVGKVIVKP